MRTRICKLCNIEKPYLRQGEYTNDRPRYVDLVGCRWNGWECPTCYKFKQTVRKRIERQTPVSAFLGPRNRQRRKVYIAINKNLGLAKVGYSLRIPHRMLALNMNCIYIVKIQNKSASQIEALLKRQLEKRIETFKYKQLHSLIKQWKKKHPNLVLKKY